MGVAAAALAVPGPAAAAAIGSRGRTARALGRAPGRRRGRSILHATALAAARAGLDPAVRGRGPAAGDGRTGRPAGRSAADAAGARSEEHTSELQSRENLVCRLLLEKKKPTADWANAAATEME